MVDREEVINGLRCCREEDNPAGWRVGGCMDCPYEPLKGNPGCAKKLKDDLLELLTPRVMTLEEVLALKFDDVVYFEVFPTKAVLSAIVLDVIPKLPDLEIGVVQFRCASTWNGINNAELSYYGKTWRCWTARPDEETRRATPWE